MDTVWSEQERNPSQMYDCQSPTRVVKCGICSTIFSNDMFDGEPRLYYIYRFQVIPYIDADSCESKVVPPSGLHTLCHRFKSLSYFPFKNMLLLFDQVGLMLK